MSEGFLVSAYLSLLHMSTSAVVLSLQAKVVSQSEEKIRPIELSVVDEWLVVSRIRYILGLRHLFLV